MTIDLRRSRHYNWRRGRDLVLVRLALYIAMARATFGSIQEFESAAETITAYVERASLYFIANNVTNYKNVPVLLSGIDIKSYGLLRNLVSPVLPQARPLLSLSRCSSGTTSPSQRFRFHRRDQASEESIAEYVAELRRLATHCKFEAYLEEALRDRLVCGLKSA